MTHHSFYRMRVKNRERMTSHSCKDTVVRLDLEPMPDEWMVRPFIAGQHVRLKASDQPHLKPGYYAIASDPAITSHYEFVIKQIGELSIWLTNAEKGNIIEVEGPMGKGFDLTPYRGRDVYLLGVGTGIAPLRSLWNHLIRHREEFGNIIIYAGFLTPLHRLLTDELADLEKHRIEVNVCVTNSDNSWSGPIGYVQDALKLSAPTGQNAIVCLAGMSAMIEACKATLKEFGFDERDILLNY